MNIYALQKIASSYQNKFASDSWMFGECDGNHTAQVCDGRFSVAFFILGSCTQYFKQRG